MDNIRIHPPIRLREIRKPIIFHKVASFANYLNEIDGKLIPHTNWEEAMHHQEFGMN